MLKKLGVLALIMVFVIGFSGVSLAENEPEYTLIYSDVASPGQPQIRAAEKFAEVVEALTDGAVVIDIHHSGTLADQTGQILGVMRGEIDISPAGPEWFADLIPFEEIAVLGSAYAYRDLDHLYQVMNGPVGKSYWDEVRERGNMVVLDTWYLGARQLNMTEGAGEIRNPEDLAGVRLRMPDTAAWMDVGRAIGASPTPVDFGELYTALDTGTVEGQDNPLPTNYAQNFHEVTHYIVMTDHYLSVINPTINADCWEELPDDYKQAILAAAKVARNYMNRIVLEEEATLLGMFAADYGMEVIYPDKDAFMAHATEYYRENKPEDWFENYLEIQEVGTDMYRP